jgi:hypothetical protein
MKTMNIKYPKIKVRLAGKDGNAFNLLGIMQHALQRGGVPKVEIDAFLKEAMSGDYDYLLQTCMKWATVS